MTPSLDKLLEALRTVDEAEEERVVSVGNCLVWGIRAQTRHPRLAATFPGGLILVTERNEALDEGSGIGVAIEACRVSLPKALGDHREPPQPEFCAAPPNAQRGTAMLGPSADFERTLCEERLGRLPLNAGRRILSEISRTRTRLSMPVLVAVRGKSGERHESALYLGARTPAAQQDENRPPGADGLGILEAIGVSRPLLPAAATIGDLLRRCQGAKSRSGEVRLRARYDLSVAVEDPTALALQLPAELLPGSFVSLVVSWPMSLQQAAPLPLLQPPSTLSCSSAIYLRCGHCPERAPLGRYLLDLHVLRALARPGAAGAALQARARAGALGGPAAALAAVARFVEKERRLATCSVAAEAGADGAAAPEAPEDRRPQARDAEDEERPDRDFVDRLWLDVLSLCETAECLAAAVGAVLEALGGHEGIAPSVRRDNGTQMAELVRQAVRLSTLRKYAAFSEAEQLRQAGRAWEESCGRLARLESVVQLALHVGVECLRRDFLHLITRRGYVTAQDLREYTEAEEAVPAQLETLRCLRHIAELALMSTRHRLWMDTMRRLVLKAAEYYRRPQRAAGDSLPVFAVPLSGASLGRLLAALPTLEPAAFAIDCGGASVQARRAPAAAEAGEEAGQAEPGVWRPAQTGGLFEYHVTVVDRFSLAK